MLKPFEHRFCTEDAWSVDYWLIQFVTSIKHRLLTVEGVTYKPNLYIVPMYKS